jgi:pimeloyl-ACP methyl ester carboxylesterase
MVAAVGDEEAFLAGLDALLAESDGDVLADPRLRSHLYSMLREGLRQGFTGVGWDNVAWVGPWDVDLAAIRCPVHLWYGELDPMVPLAHGRWLAEHLPGSELVVYEGEGHLGPMRHWREVLTTLTAAP